MKGEAMYDHTACDKNKIVLFDGNLEYAGAPLALLAISRYLAQEDYAIKIVNHRLYPDYLNVLLEECKDAICLGITASMTGVPIKIGRKAALIVKSRYPHLPIVWGGNHPTVLPNQTIQDGAVDIVVRGQGEITFREMIYALQGKQELSTVQGITYKIDGKVYVNPDRSWADMNNFPDLPFHLVDNVEKCIEVMDFGSRCLRYISSYGCPFRCGFCSEPASSGRKWGALSPKRVVDEIERLVRVHNLDSITFVDSIFFNNERRVAKICEGMIERGLEIHWGQVNGRTHQLIRYEQRTWELMQESGLYNILIGAESGDDELMHLMTKDATVRHTIEFVKLAKRYGIKTIASTIMGLPLPEYANKKRREVELRYELLGLLKLYETLFTIGSDIHVLLFSFTPLPGSALYVNSLKLGFKPPATLEEWGGYDLLTARTPWFPKRYKTLLKVMNYTFFFKGVDPKYFISGLPSGILKQLTALVFQLFQLLATIRIRHRCFSFGIDFMMFQSLMKLFKLLNRRKRLSNVG